MCSANHERDARIPFTMMNSAGVYTQLLKSNVTLRDHVSVVMDPMNAAWLTHRQFHSQFHSRRHSLRISLKSTTLVHMGSGNA